MTDPERLPKHGRGHTDWKPSVDRLDLVAFMYAPGSYCNECVDCGAGFIGDKRAMRCADCAAEMAAASGEDHG